LPFAGELTQRSEINPQAGVLAALPQSLDLTQEGGARDVRRAGRLRNGLLPEPHRKVTQFRRQGGQHPVEIEGQIGTLRAARLRPVGNVDGRSFPANPASSDPMPTCNHSIGSQSRRMSSLVPAAPLLADDGLLPVPTGHACVPLGQPRSQPAVGRWLPINCTVAAWLGPPDLPLPANFTL